MSEAGLLWIIGSAVGLILTISGPLIGHIWHRLDSHSKQLSLLTVKTAQLEIILIAISKTAAKMLHSPDDHRKMDYYVDRYVEREYELTAREWDEFLHLLQKTMEDPNESPTGVLAASFAYNVCRHKLRMAPEKRKEKQL